MAEKKGLVTGVKFHPENHSEAMVFWVTYNSNITRGLFHVSCWNSTGGSSRPKMSRPKMVFHLKRWIFDAGKNTRNAIWVTWRKKKRLFSDWVFFHDSPSLGLFRRPFFWGVVWTMIACHHLQLPGNLLTSFQKPNPGQLATSGNFYQMPPTGKIIPY